MLLGLHLTDERLVALLASLSGAREGKDRGVDETLNAIHVPKLRSTICRDSLWETMGSPQQNPCNPQIQSRELL